ncbi:ABC transporter permease protein [Furfurilactobacillus rossiae]|uniref:ABC transporter permease n=1 Tax=Furfurilactobacillus rossiae TaxID=231049 RepID=UPI0015BA061F|nr:ABC transporter permease [Furfurilactobacillus rossiae]MCF6165586.1 ABC transporter permease [Furfurilactobacillus rossiae]QLE63400.1 ABC transporter permease protein [Furfurilactobacillus rossiae]
MLTLYRQESFKLLKKKSTLWVSLFLVMVELVFAFLSKTWPKVLQPQQMFVQNFEGLALILFLAIAAAASIITMEFQYGTIKTVVSQKFSRSAVLISKWLVLFTYTIYLYVLSAIVAIIGKFVFLNSSFSLTDKGWNQKIWIDWLASLGAQFLTTWLLLSLVLLIAASFKTSAVAISVGIIGYFILNTVNTIMFYFIHLHEWLKWNPINFMNYGSQITVHSVAQYTRLSDIQLLAGNLGYIALFLAIGLLIFRKRNV